MNGSIEPEIVLAGLRDLGFCFSFISPQGVFTLGILRDGDVLGVETIRKTGPAGAPGDELTVMVVLMSAEEYWLNSAPYREEG